MLSAGDQPFCLGLNELIEYMFVVYMCYYAISKLFFLIEVNHSSDLIHVDWFDAAVQQLTILGSLFQYKD